MAVKVAAIASFWNSIVMECRNLENGEYRSDDELSDNDGCVDRVTFEN